MKDKSDAKDKPIIKKSAVTVRIIWFLLGLFFLITVISQVYIYFYNPLRTEPAMLYSHSETYNFKGVYVRNERQVRYSGADVISYIYPDGSKLSKNSVVAKSYKSRNDVLLQTKIDELKKHIELLENAQLMAGADNSQLEACANQITARHLQMLQALCEGDYGAVAGLKEEYLSFQCKKRILCEEETDYNALISQLKGQILSLEGRMGAPPRDVTIDEAGYFVSAADGYENALSYEKIPSLGKSDIEKIIREPELEIGGDIIGKMVDDYKWRFVGILDTEKTRSVFEGSTANFRIGGNPQIVETTVINVKHLGDGSSIFTFECDCLTAEYASKRVSQFSLLLNGYKGIRIPSSAVYFNKDNERGVFVKDGAKLVFRRIEVIRTEKDYFLVEDTTNKPGCISLYDNVVIKGKDLYEGKIVQ